jgi:outer membrane protein TolC
MDASIEATRDSLGYYRRILELITAQHQYGKVEALEVEQAQQACLAMQNTIIDMQLQRTRAENTLRLLLSVGPEEKLEFAFSPELLELHPNINLDIPVAILANRPDVKAAEYRLRSAFSDLKAIQKSWYPSLSLSGALSSASSSIGTMFDIPFSAGSISLDLPFLQWNTVKWNVKISETEYDSLKLDFESSINAALNEINLARKQYASALESLRNTEKKCDYNSSISKRYALRYKNGKSDLADWLQALNTQVDSRLALYKNRHDVLLYQLLFYKAMGGRYFRLH